METRRAARAAKVSADLPPLEVRDPERVRALIAANVRPDWQQAARFIWGVETAEDRAQVDWDDDELWDEE